MMDMISNLLTIINLKKKFFIGKEAKEKNIFMLNSNENVVTNFFYSFLYYPYLIILLLLIVIFFFIYSIYNKTKQKCFLLYISY